MSASKRSNRRSIGLALHKTSDVDIDGDIFDKTGNDNNLSFTATDGNVSMTSTTPNNRRMHLMTVNDDHAERRQIRQHRVIELHQQVIHSPGHDKSILQSISTDRETPSTSTTSNVAGLSANQLAEHYSNCIKLSSENKITMKNAFGLHLIDCMAEMMKKKESDMDNFQIASCTLDASAKIYGYRVDCVHAETQKIAIGLSRTSNTKNKRDDGSDENSDGEANEDEVNDTQKKKRKKVNRSTTIEKNLKNLNVNKFDCKFEVDPLFLKTTELFVDGGSGSAVLLGFLGCRDDFCELVLDSMDPIETTQYDKNNGRSLTPDNLIDISPISSILDKLGTGLLKICPTFASFEFNSWNPGDVYPNWDLDVSARNISICGTKVNGGQDDLQCGDDFNGEGDDFNGGGVDLSEPNHDDSADEVFPPVMPIPEIHIEQPTTQRREAAALMDLTRELAMEPNEYSYFKKDFASAWAGPNHWHVQPLSKGNRVPGIQVRPRPRTKKPVFRLHYSEDIDEDELENIFQRPNGKTRLSRETRKNWSFENTTFYEDIHYEAASLQQIFLKPFVKVQQKRQVNQSADADLQNYDYHNRNDVENFCPAADVDDNDRLSNLSGSDNVPSPATSRGFPESNVEFDTQLGPNVAVGQVSMIAAFAGNNLVQQPRKVATFEIPYMRAAKRINVRHLKESIWKTLTSQGLSVRELQVDKLAQLDRTPTPDVTDKGLLFREIYQHLPNFLSTENAENLNFPMAFVCVLYIANEKNLEFAPQENLKDFKIYMGEESDQASS